jgi:hypothetical protein
MKKYLIINTEDRYYPYQSNWTQFSRILEDAEEYDKMEDAQLMCERIKFTQNPYERKGVGIHRKLKIVDKEIFLRKDKLKKLNEKIGRV